MSRPKTDFAGETEQIARSRCTSRCFYRFSEIALFERQYLLVNSNLFNTSSPEGIRKLTGQFSDQANHPPTPAYGSLSIVGYSHP